MPDKYKVTNAAGEFWDERMRCWTRHGGTVFDRVPSRADVGDVAINVITVTKPEYYVATDKGLAVLMQEVGALLEDGWRCQGGLAFGGGRWAQAMVRGV